MIVLDTHAWVWWTHGEGERLSPKQMRTIQANESDVIGISAIFCWEIAKLAELGRLEFGISLDEWFEQALDYPGVKILELTPQIALESTRLPGDFHRDPADQIIVATARIYDCALITADEKILEYSHVKTIR